MGVFIYYQNIDAKKKKLHIYGIQLLNLYKTVVSHLKLIINEIIIAKCQNCLLTQTFRVYNSA